MPDQRDLSLLETAAFVGNEAAVRELQAYAESSLEHDPRASAEAYRALSEAYRHKVFVMQIRLAETERARESAEKLLQGYKAFVTFQDREVRRRIMQGTAPPYIVFKAISSMDANLQSLLTEFASYLSIDRVAEEDGQEKLFGTLTSMAYSWVSHQFEYSADDAASRSTLTAILRDFNPASITDLHLMIKLWPLVEACNVDDRAQ